MKSISLPVTLLLATGCAPLSQAPLVYNSKVIFGGRVSATNPQTPGVDINVGFTGEDSAFIPVAVGKLPKKLGGDDGESDITLIKGTYAGSVNPASVSAAADTLRAAEETLNKKSDALIAIQKQVDANNAQNATYTDLIKQQETLTTEISTLSLGSPEYVTKNNTLQSIASQLTSLRSPYIGPGVTTQAQIEKAMSDQTVQLNAALTQAQTEKDSAETNVKKATAELEKVEGKTDAYSVFGSFDSGTSLTGSTNGGVTLGKMFSTGVAAQNISQGIQQSHNYLSIKACLDSLKAAIGTVDADTAKNVCGK